MKLPVCKISAHRIDDVAAYTPVVNLQNQDFYMYVDLPEEVCCPCLVITDVAEIETDKPKSVYSSCYREGTRPWIRFKLSDLNTDIGLHKYKISFVHVGSAMEFALYFQYIVQSDNPDKPYIYMHRDE